MTFIDSVVNDEDVVSLVGDEATPGDGLYYSTSDVGTRGWHPLTHEIRISSVDATLVANDDEYFVYDGVGDKTLALTAPLDGTTRNYFMVKNAALSGNLNVHDTAAHVIDNAGNFIILPGQFVEFTYDLVTLEWYSSFGQHPLSLGAVERNNGGREAIHTYNTVTGATTVQLADGNVLRVNLTGNATIAVAGAVSGVACSVTLVLVQDGTGSRIVTWNAAIKWPGGTAPTLSTTAAAVDIVTMFTIDSGTTWYAGLVGKAYA